MFTVTRKAVKLAESLRPLVADSTLHREEYLRSHLRRLYHTYVLASQVLSQLKTSPARVLSLGIGAGYVERLLAREFAVRVTGVDFFPSAIGILEYSSLGFEVVSHDLTKRPWPIIGTYHLVLSCEVLEHLPIDAEEHFRDIYSVLATHGYVIFSTPNLGCLRNVVRLARGLSILPMPSQMFAPAGPENQHIHRREYTSSELIRALRENHFQIVILRYTWPSLGRVTLKRGLALLLELVFPFWRPQIVGVAKKL